MTRRVVVDEEVLADLPRSLPELLSDGPASEKEILAWWEASEARVKEVGEAVLALGADSVVAALEAIGVLRELRAWEEED